LFVRVEGLEPPCLAAPDPKSGVSTNFTTPALEIKNLTIVNFVNWRANVGEISKNEMIGLRIFFVTPLIK